LERRVLVRTRPCAGPSVSSARRSVAIAAPVAPAKGRIHNRSRERIRAGLVQIPAWSRRKSWRHRPSAETPHRSEGACVLAPCAAGALADSLEGGSAGNIKSSSLSSAEAGGGTTGAACAARLHEKARQTAVPKRMETQPFPRVEEEFLRDVASSFNSRPWYQTDSRTIPSNLLVIVSLSFCFGINSRRERAHRSLWSDFPEGSAEPKPNYH
jgi:hypothetical protein